MKDSTKKLFVISGSSGVGKGTVIKSLLSKRSDIMLSISYTTRKPRPNEKEGIKRYNQGDALFVCGSKRMQISVIATDAELDSFGTRGGL